MEVTVDSDMTSMYISITGPTMLYDAFLRNPLGVYEFAGNTSSKWMENNTLIMSVQKLPVGTWFLIRIDGREWNVNITADTGIRIDFQLIQTDGTGFHTILDRSPIAGRMYTLAIIASNIDSSFTASSYSLHDEEGDLIANATLNMSFTHARSIGYAEVTIPSSTFYVRWVGFDSSGSQFTRMSWKQVIPVSVDLVVHPVLGLIGSTENITYSLTNNAAITKIYDVTMSSSVTSSITRVHTTMAFETIDDTFDITTTSDIDSLSYAVAVSDNGTFTTLQSRSYTLQLVGTLCTTTTTSYGCGNVNSSCSAYQWTATAVFNFDVSMFVVTTGVSMSDHSTDNTRLYISGDCCNVNVSLAAYSVSGDGCQVMIPSGLPEQEEQEGEEESQSFRNIIIGSVVAVVAFGLITAGICKLFAIKKANRVQSKDYTTGMDENPFASIHFQHGITAPVATSFTTKKCPLLEKDYLKAYNVRPQTAVSRDFSSRPTSGHISIYVNSRPNSFR
ncbi:hypothetical protein KP79_PYT22625 [Mizuhopecten yessoensis]|uniref:Transmembrane protein n=2 Tax=Mizuhopecten yessoensis TaxID=6573 RepID=A0A210PMV8_MIZYE|nr:hypothetical protein KP79_PYT22625 [Mizuhopecten yessoensis]